MIEIEDFDKSRRRIRKFLDRIEIDFQNVEIFSPLTPITTNKRILKAHFCSLFRPRQIVGMTLQWAPQLRHP